jgi:hypothetical protein
MRRFPVVPTMLVAVLTLAAVTGTAWSASEESALKQLENPVSGDETLGRLMGKWTGEGVVRQSAGGSEEPVKCRLTSTWTAENKLMRMMLACRGIDYVFTATSYIGRSGSIYRGSLNSSVSGEANVAGKRTGNGLSFNMVGNSAKGPVQSALSLVIAGDRVTNTVQRTDPDSGQRYTALQVTMAK